MEWPKESRPSLKSPASVCFPALRRAAGLRIFAVEVSMFSTGETILLGENYENDEFFFIRTLKYAQIACSVRVMETGLEVVHYLQGRGKFVDREQHPLPALIFLEMYLPTISGLEILQWAQTQEHLRAIPTVLFVDEINAAAYHRAKSLGAVGCIAKPFTVEHIEWLKEQVQHA